MAPTRWSIGFRVVDDPRIADTDAVEEVSGSIGDVDGRLWLTALPVELEGQRKVLARLLDLCVATPLARSLSVGCSLGRGAADALSDVDVAVGVDAARGGPGADHVTSVEHAVVSAFSDGDYLVGVLRDRVGPPDRFIRRVFAQFRDGVQLDLAIMAETEVRRGQAAPDFVSLYRSRRPAKAEAGNSVGSPGVADFAGAHTVTPEQIYDWTFLGWCALADLGKYLDRRSLWEAHHRLHEARHRVWTLWAAANGAAYPGHGLSQVLDQDPQVLPPGIEATVAALDQADLLRAARATADVLAQISALAASRHDAPLPRGMADYVTARLRA